MEGWQSFIQCGVVKVTSDSHECSRLMIQQSRHSIGKQVKVNR